MSQNTTSSRYGDAYGRWAGLGPYYAMFPVQFAREVIDGFCKKDGGVIDPFCGRGTVPFVAQATNRQSIGIDSNPVAWVFARAKTDTCRNKNGIIKRVHEIHQLSKKRDSEAKNEFQKWAWSPPALRFLNSARIHLDWQNNQIDRTLMGFILAGAHARKGDGISNQMQKSRAMGPHYSVRWWKERKMKPPKVDPVEHFTNRIKWRYRHGTINRENPATLYLGKAETKLSQIKKREFDLLFTSPPYYNITSYLHDSWIRLWLLGEGKSIPDWQRDRNIHGMVAYKEMMHKVFVRSKKMLKDNATVWVRTDARKFTQETTKEVLLENWGDKCLYHRTDIPNKTQTEHFGRYMARTGEVDFLVCNKSKDAKKWGFVRVH